MAMPGTETIRFRRPTNKNEAAPEPKKDQFGDMAPQGWKRRHQGLLQDLLRRSSQGPLIPSLSVAFRMLLLMRTVGAMYATIADCDEVFNFYEPLHFFQHNGGFQTWELSPEFGIRSWAYVLLHWPMAHILPRLLRFTKRGEFFTLRMCLAFISSFCEARFYRAVVEALNERVGRYLLFFLLTGAGMYNASIAFLPSSFAMYTTMLAFSYSLHPATSTSTGTSRAYKAIFFFALGAIVGWPFSALLAVPFVIEQLFMCGDDVALGGAKTQLLAKRWSTLAKAAAVGASIAVPVITVDSYFYGRTTVSFWNIIYYNIISPLGGPELYGTESSTFYIANLLLNFNVLLPLALISLPGLLVTMQYDKRRLGRHQRDAKPDESSPYALLAVRLAPFYLWLAVLSLQPHKEERFMYPAYPLLAMNAAVGLYLIKGWTEQAYIKYTKSSYKASQTQLFSNLTLLTVLFTAILSLGRINALYRFYHAPIDMGFHFQTRTVPAILSTLGYTAVQPDTAPAPGEVIRPEWDMTALYDLEPRVTLCFAEEWYRYPSSYLVPDGIEVQWVQTEFDGMMPRRWDTAQGLEETSKVHPGRFNGVNRASSEPGTYVQPEQCDYLVSLYLPSDKSNKWFSNPEWQEEHCIPFLDAASTPFWARLIDLPGAGLDGARTWGKYCLLRRSDTPYPAQGEK